MTESESVALPLGDAAIFGTVYIIPPFLGFVKGVMKIFKIFFWHFFDMNCFCVRNRIFNLCGVCSSSWRQTKNNKGERCSPLFFLARPGGFEPPTYRFVAGHSIRWAKGASRVLEYITTKNIFCQGVFENIFLILRLLLIIYKLQRPKRCKREFFVCWVVDKTVEIWYNQ